MTPLSLQLERVPSPVGSLFVVTDEQGHLRAVDFEDHEARLHRLLRRHYGLGGFTLAARREPSQPSAAHHDGKRRHGGGKGRGPHRPQT